MTIDSTTLTVITLLSGLLGSILTVVLSKALELIQKSKEHKYSLQKLFFEKKLNAAETTTVQFQILANACFNISVLFERLRNNSEQDTDDENFVDKHLIEQVTQQSESANSASFMIAYSVTLYFDLGNEFQNNERIRSFYEFLGRLHTAQKQFHDDYEFYLARVGSQYEAQAKEIYEQSQQNLQDTLKTISDEYKAFNQEIVRLLNQIRNQMKKFDY